MSEPGTDRTDVSPDVPASLAASGRALRRWLTAAPTWLLTVVGVAGIVVAGLISGAINGGADPDTPVDGRPRSSAYETGYVNGYAGLSAWYTVSLRAARDCAKVAEDEVGTDLYQRGADVSDRTRVRLVADWKWGCQDGVADKAAGRVAPEFFYDDDH